MSLDYTIRPIRPEDLDTILAIWLEMARQHTAYDAERWRWADDAVEVQRKHLLETVTRADAITFVAEDVGGEILGYVFAGVTEPAPVWKTRRRGQIYDLCVAPASRRRGVGRALMLVAMDALKACGVQDVVLRVAVQNAEAVSFYKSLGLRVTTHEMFLPIDRTPAE